MARGYQRRQQRKERRDLIGWQLARLQVTIQLNINREQGTPAYSPEEVFALPGDSPLEFETLQPDEVEGMWAESDQLDADIL